MAGQLEEQVLEVRPPDLTVRQVDERIAILFEEQVIGRTLRNTDYIAVTDGPGNIERCFMKSFYRLEKIE